MYINANVRNILFVMLKGKVKRRSGKEKKYLSDIWHVIFLSNVDKCSTPKTIGNL